MISSYLAEILGLLCAEGSHILSYTSHWEMHRGKPRYRENRKQERIEFYNKDRKLLLHYGKLLMFEFGLDPKITKHGKINIGKLDVIRVILSYTDLGHMSWKVPGSVITGNKEVKIAFLRGFFDGDGTAVSVVRFFSTNKRGLTQISRLLNDLEFVHTIQAPVIKGNRKPFYTLQLSRRDCRRFIDMVEPISKLPKKIKNPNYL